MSNQRFTRAKGDGQSQCYNCGCVSWDSFLFIDNAIVDAKHTRICENCKKLVEEGREMDAKIVWRNFVPFHRDFNRWLREEKKIKE